MIARRLLSALLCCCLALLASMAPAYADGERVVRVDPVVRDGKLYIDADVDLAVVGDLRKVAEKGVPIYFTADLEIVSHRWWWFDETIANKHQTWRIVYNALTRQWRVGSGELSLPESSLDNAMSLVRNIRGWSVADAGKLVPGKQYHGRLRIRLDTSLLARPFQIDALNSSSWSLATPWKEFTFSVSENSRDPS